MPDAGARICPRCGAVNRGRVPDCLLCGATLPEPLPLETPVASPEPPASEVPPVSEMRSVPAPPVAWQLPPRPKEPVVGAPVVPPPSAPAETAPARRLPRWVWIAVSVAGIGAACCAISAIIYILVAEPAFLQELPRPQGIATGSAGALRFFLNPIL